MKFNLICNTKGMFSYAIEGTIEERQQAFAVSEEFRKFVQMKVNENTKFKEERAVLGLLGKKTAKRLKKEQEVKQGKKELDKTFSSW